MSWSSLKWFYRNSSCSRHGNIGLSTKITKTICWPWRFYLIHSRNNINLQIFCNQPITTNRATHLVDRVEVTHTKRYPCQYLLSFLKPSNIHQISIIKIDSRLICVWHLLSFCKRPNDRTLPYRSDQVAMLSRIQPTELRRQLPHLAKQVGFRIFQ